MKTCPNENCSRKLEKIIKQRMNIYDENNSSQNDQTNYSHQYALTQPSNDGPKYNHIFNTVSEFDSKTHNNHKYKKKRNLSINDCPGGNSCKNYKQITELQSQVQKLSKTVEELTKVNEYFKFMLLQKERMYQILLAKTSSPSKSKEPPTTPRIPKKVRQSLTKEETACMYGSNNTNNMNINSKHKVNPYEKLMEISTRNQKHNLQNSSGVSFLALSDERLRELISNPSLNHLYQLTLSDEIFIKEFKTADNDALISYCDVISSVTKDYQNTLNLIRSIKHFMLGSVELVNSVFLNNTTSVLIANTNRVLDCENTSIYIHDSFTDMLIEHTSATAGSAPSKAMNTKDSNNIVSTVFNTGERIKIDDIATDTRFTKRSSHHSKLKNILCYPLRDNDGDIFGVIEATNKRKGCFDNNDEEILSCYSKQASGILQHRMNIESSLTQINKLKNIITYQIEISNPRYRVIDFVKRTEQLVERVFMSSSSQVLLDVNGKLYDPKKKAYVSELGLVHYVYRKKECHGCSDVKHCQYYNMLTDIYSVDSLVTYPVIEPDNDRVVGIIQTIFNAKLSDKYNLPKHNEMMLFNLIGNCFAIAVSNCLYRHDVNVYISFISLLLIRKFYPYNPKYVIKVALHLIVAVTVFDVLYCLCVVPFWNSGSSRSDGDKANVIVVDAWSTLYGVRMVTMILTVVEIGVKCILGWMLFRDFKLYPMSAGDSLLSFDYVNTTDFNKPIKPVVNLNPNSNIYYQKYTNN